MKYFLEGLNDNNEFERTEINKTEAIRRLSNFYKNVEELVETPCYYRTMFGGVEVVEEDEV